MFLGRLVGLTVVQGTVFKHRIQRSVLETCFLWVDVLLVPCDKDFLFAFYLGSLCELDSFCSSRFPNQSRYSGAEERQILRAHTPPPLSVKLDFVAVHA